MSLVGSLDFNLNLSARIYTKPPAPYSLMVTPYQIDGMVVYDLPLEQAQQTVQVEGSHPQIAVLAVVDGGGNKTPRNKIELSIITGGKK